jgi:hypothetical protein
VHVPPWTVLDLGELQLKLQLEPGTGRVCLPEGFLSLAARSAAPTPGPAPAARARRPPAAPPARPRSSPATAARPCRARTGRRARQPPVVTCHGPDDSGRHRHWPGNTAGYHPVSGERASRAGVLLEQSCVLWSRSVRPSGCPPEPSSSCEAPPQNVELLADLVFPLAFTVLTALTQGPAVTLADRSHPLRRSSDSPPNRPCHSEVAGQGTACRLWSGCSRHYASGKLSPRSIVPVTR